MAASSTIGHARVIEAHTQEWVEKLEASVSEMLSANHKARNDLFFTLTTRHTESSFDCCSRAA